MFYTIKPNKGKGYTVFISMNLYEKMHKHIHNIFLCAGGRKKRVQVLVQKDLKEDTIMVSEQTLIYLSIPFDLKYQIQYENEKLIIGPIVGLLVSKGNKQLSKNTLEKYKEYVSLYKQFQGLIYIFSWEGIDFSNEKIEGYFYSPESNDWQKGSFPYPNSIYKRASLPHSKIDKLKLIASSRVFNSYYQNKLKQWDLASKSHTFSAHIPHTMRLLSLDDVDYMLTQYNEVYLKEVSGTLGKGLVKVTKSPEGYCFETNDGIYPIKIANREAASQYVRRLLENCPYLVQQAVKTLKLEKRLMDFRVVMQKDDTLQWKCTAIIAKIGKEGGIYSAFMERGFALSFEEALLRIPSIEKSKIASKKQEVIKVCMMMCKLLNKTKENYGDLGIDAAIDESGKVWIFEVNQRHDHTVILSLKDEETYRAICTNTVKYAIALSGFDTIHNE